MRDVLTEEITQARELAGETLRAVRNARIEDHTGLLTSVHVFAVNLFQELHALEQELLSEKKKAKPCVQSQDEAARLKYADEDRDAMIRQLRNWGRG